MTFQAPGVAGHSKLHSNKPHLSAVLTGSGHHRLICLRSTDAPSLVKDSAGTNK